MSHLNQAIENVRATARVFQSVIDLAEALAKVGSIEQATVEANAALAKVRNEVTAAESKLSEQRLKADAEYAQADAASIVEAAKTVAESLRAEAQADRDAAKAALTEAQDRAESMALDVKAKEQEIADLDARIEKARKQIAKLLEG
jgi:predicted  nucleic acid-binding Zn-ribbon protein